MISLVAKTISIFAVTLQTILYLASFIGKLIISTVTWISSGIIGTLKSIVIFFQIVYEDNVFIFTEEIPSSASGLIDTIINQIINVQNGIVDFYNDLFYKLNAVLAVVKLSTQAIAAVFSEVLCLLKTTIIFVGDTVWLIVTFVPVHLPQLIKAVFKYIGYILVNIAIDIYMTLLKFTNYLTEVPLQSFMGITSAIVIVRLCVHFRATIIIHIGLLYWSLVRTILYYYYALFNYFTNSDVGIISQMTSGLDTVETSSHDSNDVIDAVDSLCVICQERQKCVLTLPCRHVCLCTDCCRRLYGYQRTCPICRTFIYHTVTVYL